MFLAYRIAFRMCVWICVGAVVSFFLAQVIAVQVPRPPKNYNIYLTDNLMGGQHRSSRLATQVTIYSTYRHPIGCGTGRHLVDYTKIPIYATADPEHHRILVSGDLPSWVQLLGTDGFVRAVVTNAYGWPFRSVRAAEGYLDQPGFPYVSHEWAVIDLSRFGLNQSWHCPTKIIWSGMAANTLCFGGSLFLIGLPRRSVRDALRKHRGHCPRCKYDLGYDFESGCPECGWNRASA